MARVIACKWAPGMRDPATLPGAATRTYLLRIGGRVREVEEGGNTCDALYAASPPAYDAEGAAAGNDGTNDVNEQQRGVQRAGEERA